MASIRAYAAPLPGRGRWAIGLPPTTRRELAGLAWWWTATAAPLRLDLYVAAPLDDDGTLQRAVARVLSQAAASAAATPTAAGQAAGPRPPADSAARTRHRLLTVAIAIWGWTVVLGSGGNPLATIGGLWLAIGVPLMRAWYGRAQRRWAAGLQETLGSFVGRSERAADLAGAPELRQVPHRGLADLAARCAEADDDTAALLALWRHCARADLADLRPFYAARLAAAQVNTATMPEETRHWFEVELTSATATASEPDSPSPQTEATATLPAIEPEDDHRSL